MELIITLGIIVGIGVVTFLVIYFALAPRNLFFTFVREGTAKIIVRGDKFEKALIQWEGRTFQHQIPGEEKWQVISGAESHLFGGLRYYGAWPIFDVYIYDFQWTGVAEDGKVIHHPKETLDYIILRDDIYWCEVEDAEDKKLLPLSLELILTIAVVNPYKALFNIQNWLETVINRIQPAVRQIITTKSFEKWIVEKADLARIIFLALQGKDGNGNFDPTLTDLISEFRSLYGVDIQAFAVQEINPPEEQRQATLKKYLADQEAKGVVVSARAEAKKIIHLAEAERRRLETVFGQIQKFGDLGPALRALEAMERSQNWVVSAPELAGILRRALGTRPSGSP